MTKSAEVWKNILTDKAEVALLDGPQGSKRFQRAAKMAGLITNETSSTFLENATVEDILETITWASWLSSKPRLAVVGSFASAAAQRTLESYLKNKRDTSMWWLCTDTQQDFQGLGFRYHFNLLEPEEVEAELSDNFPESPIDTYAYSSGSLERAQQLKSSYAVCATVASWVAAVDDASRSLLLEAVKSWGTKHTTLLMAELEHQMFGKTLIEVRELRRIPKERISKALSLLSDNPSKATAAAVGLSLMRR